GYPREVTIGHYTSELNIWADPADQDTILKKFRKNGKINNEICRFRVKSGEIRTMLMSLEEITIGGQQCRLSVSADITGHLHTENALKESEDKFSVAFRSSPDIMALVNMEDGTYTEVNDSFVHFTGYTSKELIGHTNDEFGMWIDPEEQQRMIKLVDTKGNFRHEEFNFRMKSGEVRVWLCSADILNIGGAPYMLAVATDITERKRVQRALRESEEKFNTAFNASPGSISISRQSDNRFIEVNDSFLRDKGFTRDEVIGHTAFELNLWEKQEDRQRVMRIIQEQGKVHNELVNYRTKSGELKTGYFSGETISLGGEPCLIMQTIDITKQKQAEKQLRLLSSITEQVSDSTIVTDADFKITYMNKTATDLLGYTLEEAAGQKLSLFNAKPMTKRRAAALRKQLAEGKPWSSIAQKRRKDGTVITCNCRISPLLDENGEICAYIDIQHDITRQKETEDKLHFNKQLVESILASMPEGVLVINQQDNIVLANAAFHRIFNIRKRSAMNRKLKELLPVGQLMATYQVVKGEKLPESTLEFRYQKGSVDKIIAAVVTRMENSRMLLTFSDISRDREEEEKLYLTDRLASIGEMATGLVHELNNPLTGILALSQMMLEGDMPEEHREDLTCVYDEAKRAAGIVKNVLLFTRNNHYEHGRSSANEVVKDVLRLREYEEHTNNITVVADLEHDLPDIAIDKYQLQQVYLNMILNAEAAIKTTDRPGLLNVTTERKNGHVNVIFKDNGCGIKKSVLPRIFDPFFTTKDIGKGTGLGLSICYGIIIKHGGKISVKTQVNEGTTFTITLPAAAGREPDKS
ncbi:MAG: PAS domain S-box protein, partial [Dehalococcoidales bacterium]|nr:PAS domain S-box protein [Dehalococcoidales bacterium]